MCFSPQRRAIFRHLNFKKWSEHAVFCTFWLQNVLLATAACNSSTSQLQKVVRTCSVLYILTSKCASRHSGVQFLISPLTTWLRTRRFNEPTFRLTRHTNHWKNTISSSQIAVAALQPSCWACRHKNLKYAECSCYPAGSLTGPATKKSKIVRLQLLPCSPLAGSSWTIQVVLEILWRQAQQEGCRAATAIWLLEIFWTAGPLRIKNATVATAIWLLKIFWRCISRLL